MRPADGYGRAPPAVQRETRAVPGPEVLMIVGMLLVLIPFLGALLGWAPLVFDTATLFAGIFLGCGVAFIGIVWALSQRR